MKLIGIAAATAFALTSAMAAVAQLPLPLPLQLVGSGHPLYQLCVRGGSESYVGVLYDNGSQVTYNYGQCYPYVNNGVTARIAVFCQSVTCISHPNPDCSGGDAPPVGIPIPAHALIDNVADFVEIIGQGATCQPNPTLQGL